MGMPGTQVPVVAPAKSSYKLPAYPSGRLPSQPSSDEIATRVTKDLFALTPLRQKDRQALFHDIAAGNLKTIDEYAGLSAANLRDLVELTRLAAGSRGDEYPSEATLTALYGWWMEAQREANGKTNLMLLGLAKRWKDNVLLPGVKVKYINDGSGGLPDGSTVKPGQTFHKEYIFQNAGTVAFPKGMAIELVREQGSTRINRPEPIFLPELAPNAQCTVGVDITIPANAANGTWTGDFLVTALVDGRRVYTRARPELLGNEALTGAITARVKIQR
jgi:hypothetical protein